MAVDTVLKDGQVLDSSCSRSRHAVSLGSGIVPTIENVVSTMLEGGQVFDPSSSRFCCPPGLDSGVVPTIENVVSTVNLACTLDLRTIALHAPNTEYNPAKFDGVRMSLKESKTTAVILSSGEMVCRRAKSEKQSLLAARKYARIIQKLGFEVKFKDFKIKNMVATFDFGFPLNLTRLAYSHHGQYTFYEPELFQGLIYWPKKQSKILVMAFWSGRIAIYGAQNRDEISKAFENIYPILKSFRIVKQKSC